MFRTILISIVIIIFHHSVLAQSPWARSKSGFYAQLGYNFIPTYGTLFGKDGEDIILDHEVSEQQIQLYGEYGLSNKTTLILSLPYVINERGASNPDSPLMFAVEDTGSISGLGNTRFAVRHQFLNGHVALAGTMLVGLPAPADYQPFTELSTGYDALLIQPMISIGKGFGRYYAYGYGSYGFRSNDYSHFLNLGVEGGAQLGHFWVIAFSEWLYSLENGSRGLPGLDVLTGLNANDQGWFSFGLKAIWQINRFTGITVSGAGAFGGQYVPKSPGIGISAYFKWD